MRGIHLLLTIFFSLGLLVQAFQPIHHNYISLKRIQTRKNNNIYTILNESNDLDSSSSSINDVVVVTSLPKDENVWKEAGEKIIMNAALNVGSNNNLKEEDIDIQWKPGRIIVTIKNSILKGGDNDDEEDDVEIEYDDDDDGFYLEDVEDGDADDDEEEDSKEEGNDDDIQADIVTIARAINYAFGEEGEGSIAYAIAANHEIEVTTPGAPDELEGIMFESYKGFNVIVETIDPKKKDGKIKIVEGNLIERNKEFTVLNCKGRRSNLKNQNVLSVKLPKAKREKGVK